MVALASDRTVFGSSSAGWVVTETTDGARAWCIDLSIEMARARQSTCDAAAREKEDCGALPSIYIQKDAKNVYMRA